MCQVSVIVPTYNRGPLIEEAVRSILQQSFREIEIVVLDDGSTDDTYLRLSHLQRELELTPGAPTLRVHYQDHLGFPGQARNVAAGLARGRYLAFLDSDDLWLPGKLEAQLALHQADAAVRISHTREEWMRGGRSISQVGQKHKREGFLFYDALWKCIMGPSTVVMGRELFEEYGGFREEIEIAEDYELWLRITTFERVGYLNTPYTVKRDGNWGQLSHKYGHIEGFRITALCNLIDSGWFPDDLASHARQTAVRKCSIYSEGCRKRGRFADADHYLHLAGLYSS